MGEYSDLSLEQHLNVSYGDIFKRVPVLVAHLGTCTKIPIREMSTIYVRNALSRCISREWRVDYTPFLKSELNNRGIKT